MLLGLRSGFGSGGFPLQDGEVREERGGALTTGLARAELALDDARELELRWPLCSEGCPHSPAPDTQTETEGQSQQRRTEAGGPAKCSVSCEVSHAQCRRQGGLEHRLPWGSRLRLTPR